MRVAIVGVGRLGAFHAKLLSALPEVTELRIHDVDGARADAVARELGASRAGSAAEALGNADAAVIVTPTGTHAALIHQCLDRGLPTFCEKPIALDLDSTQRVVEHAARSGGKLQIGFQRRFDRGFLEARRRVRAGELGTVYSFSMTSRDATPPPDAYVETSGGQFVDQLIHDFDVVRWLFGDEVQDLYATGSTLGFAQYEGFGDVSTSAAVLRLRGGAVGLLQAARHNEAGYDIRAEIYGAKDSIAIGLDPRTPLVSVESDGPRMKSPAYPSFFIRFADAYRAELEHFLRFARGEAENLCGPEDAREALRIALAARLSLREVRPVGLHEI